MALMRPACFGHLESRHYLLRTPGQYPASVCTRTWLSGFYLHAMPERDTAADFAGCRLGFGVVPDRIQIGLTVNFQAVVISGALPGAKRGGVAIAQKFTPQ
jgi:hypothetical protein